jgi:hypothetical protein
MSKTNHIFTSAAVDLDPGRPKYPQAPQKKQQRNDTLFLKELNFLSDELKLVYTSHGGQARNVYFFTFKFSNVLSHKNRGLNSDSAESPCIRTQNSGCKRANIAIEQKLHFYSPINWIFCAEDDRL